MTRYLILAALCLSTLSAAAEEVKLVPLPKAPSQTQEEPYNLMIQEQQVLPKSDDRLTGIHSTNDEARNNLHSVKCHLNNRYRTCF
jgi:hypothetical protein